MKKIVLISLALVLALGALGVGYASWHDTVTIGGPVTTGEVCIEITCPISQTDPDISSPPYTAEGGAPVASFDWNAVQPPGLGFWQGAVRTNKNVGWLETDCDVAVSPRKVLELTFHNVYPCYLNHIGFGISNCGTIPVKVDHVIFTDEAGVEQILYGDGYLVFDLSNNGVDDFEIEWGDNFGAQIEPEGFLSIDFYCHFLQDEDIDYTLPQTFTLTVEVVVVQWDKWPL